jgi:hypothetical protein
MKYRHHWRALPSGRDIGGAKVVHDRNAKPPGKRRSVAKLDAEPALRPMHNGLTMEPDHRDRAWRHPVCRQKSFDRLGMHVGHRFFRLDQNLRPLRPIREIGRGSDGMANLLPLRFAVRPISSRTETPDLFAIRLDEGYINPIIRSATHQADGSQQSH